MFLLSSTREDAKAAMFPPADALERLEMLRDFDPKLRRALSRRWTEIKAR